MGAEHTGLLGGTEEVLLSSANARERISLRSLNSREWDMALVDVPPQCPPGLADRPLSIKAAAAHTSLG